MGFINQHPPSQGLHTRDDFARLSDLPENAEKQLELIAGTIEEQMPPSADHAYIANRFGRFLDEFVENHDLGYVFGDGCTYVLSDVTVLVPDCSFIAKAQGITPPFGVRFYLAPDLAIEVVSPANCAQQLMTRIEQYLRHGTRLVWAAYPETRDVYAWRLSANGTMTVRKFDLSSALDGEDVLPGFTLEVRRLFPK